MHMCMAWSCSDHCGISHFTLAWGRWILSRLMEILCCWQQQRDLFGDNWQRYAVVYFCQCW